MAVGLGLTYFTLAGFFNSTTVSAANGRLVVRHGPLPWPGNLDLPGSGVKQLHTTQKVSSGKNGQTLTYEVGLVGSGGERKTLLKGLEEPEQALFVEQRLERHLRIEDQAVAGELPR